MPFADIDMLELPESETLMSQTESISDSPQSAPRPQKAYPTLRHWLGGAELEFQFDADSHRHSAHHADDFSHAQAAHVTRLYKVVEALADLPEEEAADDEAVGVVTASRDRTTSGAQSATTRRLNAAFGSLVESTDEFVAAVAPAVDDAAAADYADLSALLDAIRAHLFCAGDRQRAEHVVRWINRWDPRPDNAEVDDVMYATPTPYTHAHFWRYMADLVTRGLFDMAALSLRALKYEAAADRSPAVVALVADVATLLDSYTGMALKGQFAQWKLTVCELRDSVAGTEAHADDVRMVSGVHDLLRILLGLPKTIAAHTATWYDMYGALALYVVRDAGDGDYAQWFQLAVAEKGSDPALPVEQAFCDLMRGHYLRVVLAVDRLDPATAAYVAKLMEWRGCFRADYAEVEGVAHGRLVSDYLLTRHAYECFETHALVPVAAGLVLAVVHSPGARATLAQFLPHYECFTNDDLEWALTLCTKLQLAETAKTLYVRQGQRLLDQGHVYEALTMFVRCYDDSASPETAAAMRHIHHVAWELVFQDLVLNSAPVADVLIANVVSHTVDPSFEVHPVLRQCLAPYAVWTEYLAALPQVSGSRDVFAKNLSRLFHLLRFKYLPRKFAPLLFAQLLPMFGGGAFQLPDLIVVIELLDTFERHLREEEADDDVDELYLYAVENPPPVALDWRAVLKAQGDDVPPTVAALMRELRERIVAQIGRVYVETARV